MAVAVAVACRGSSEQVFLVRGSWLLPGVRILSSERHPFLFALVGLVFATLAHALPNPTLDCIAPGPLHEALGLLVQLHFQPTVRILIWVLSCKVHLSCLLGY